MDTALMKELRVGVIGCGSMAQGSHLPNLNEIDGARLAWACDLDPETLARVTETCQPEQTTDDYGQVIGDPTVDAVVLATDQRLRLPVIQAAAEAGKAVYCEKPMANSIEEMEAIAKVVDQAGIVFCVGHKRRSAPAMKYARELFHKQRREPHPCPWRLDRNSRLRERWDIEDQAVMVLRINDDLLSWKEWAVEPGVIVHGSMLFEMTHFTDLACYCIGAKPVRVMAVGSVITNHTVSITFEDGSLATIIDIGVGTFGYPKELYEMYANGGAVVIDHFAEVRTGGMEGVEPRTVFPFRHDPSPGVTDGGGIRDQYVKRRVAEQKVMETGDAETAFQYEPPVDKGHKAHLAQFLNAVRGQCESPCGAADAILATRISFAALESLQRQAPVDL
jgi:myo-inositol 2-dehydrogenase / D-chiro-inositol 1-dehydrogenase